VYYVRIITQDMRIMFVLDVIHSSPVLVTAIEWVEENIFWMILTTFNVINKNRRVVVNGNFQ
jgi:hypothetical protein